MQKLTKWVLRKKHKLLCQISAVILMILILMQKTHNHILRGISKENIIDQEGLTWSPFCCWTSGGTVATFKGWLTGGPLHKSQVGSPYQFYSVQSRIRVKSAVKKQSQFALLSLVTMSWDLLKYLLSGSKCNTLVNWNTRLYTWWKYGAELLTCLN